MSSRMLQSPENASTVHLEDDVSIAKSKMHESATNSIYEKRVLRREPNALMLRPPSHSELEPQAKQHEMARHEKVISAEVRRCCGYFIPAATVAAQGRAEVWS